MTCMEWPKERISRAREVPRLRSLVRVCGGRRWRAGEGGEAGVVTGLAETETEGLR
jgi:hypothetical protein